MFCSIESIIFAIQPAYAPLLIIRERIILNLVNPLKLDFLFHNTTSDFRYLLQIKRLFILKPNLVRLWIRVVNRLDVSRTARVGKGDLKLQTENQTESELRCQRCLLEFAFEPPNLTIYLLF